MPEDYIKAISRQVEENRRDSQIYFDVIDFMDTVHRTNYVKNFTWMGRPIMQLPSDLMGLQMIIWRVNPDVIIETGTAFGGSAIFFASLLVARESLGYIITIDKELRKSNREAIESHPLQYDQAEYRWLIEIIEGDSISAEVVEIVKKDVGTARRVMVMLDSNHTHDHVLQELRLYSPFVSIGSYIVVMDTSVEFLNPKYIPAGKPWGKGNNPWTAVQEFMKDNPEFVVDSDIEMQILLTSAPGGWLRRVKSIVPKR